MKVRPEFVYVLDKDGKPLMPTKRFWKVRRMLKSGLAKVARRDVFTIQLCYEPETNEVQDVTVGCDVGYSHIGLSASSSKYEYYSEVTETEKGMKNRLKTRRLYRRDRRNRKCRRREPRFSNRKSSKPEGWLAPSIARLRDTHVRRLKFISSILPVSHMNIEINSFDIQKMNNPDIQGVEYQHGDTYGYENKRQFVLARDNRKCQHCKEKSKTKILEVHHILWKSKGGTDVVDNLITLCHECHTKVHQGDIKLKAKPKKGFAGAAGVSSMKNSLIKVLKENSSVPVDITFGYITKCDRIEHNISKTHHLDAFAISKNFAAKRLGYHYVCLQCKRHERSLHVHNFMKKGIRRSNIAEKYINGSKFMRGDYVVCGNKRGFISGSTNGRAVINDIYGHKVTKSGSVLVNKLKLIRHQHGLYRVDIVKD